MVQSLVQALPADVSAMLGDRWVFSVSSLFLIADTDDFEEELYNNGDPKTPVFEWSTKHGQYTIKQLARVLILEDIEPSRVCTGTPMNISHNVAFVVNIEKAGGLGDLKADEMGVWNRQGSPKAYVSIQPKGSKKDIIRRQKDNGSALSLHNHPNLLSQWVIPWPSETSGFCWRWGCGVVKCTVWWECKLWKFY